MSVTTVERVKRAVRDGHGDAIRSGAETTTTLKRKQNAAQTKQDKARGGLSRMDRLIEENEQLRAELEESRTLARERLIKARDLEILTAELQQRIRELEAGSPPAPTSRPTPPPPPPTPEPTRPTDIEGIRAWLTELGRDEHVGGETRDELHTWLEAFAGRPLDHNWRWVPLRMAMFQSLNRRNMRDLRTHISANM